MLHILDGSSLAHEICSPDHIWTHTPMPGTAAIASGSSLERRGCKLRNVEAASFIIDYAAQTAQHGIYDYFLQEIRMQLEPIDI